MKFTYTLDYGGAEYLNGRFVNVWDDDYAPACPIHSLEYEDGEPESRESDPVFPTYHERKNARIGQTRNCNCEHCQGHDQSHGFRSRGPKQVPEWHGRRQVEYGLWPVRVGSYNSWKRHRRYQAHDRVPIPRVVDVVDVLNGLYGCKG